MQKKTTRKIGYALHDAAQRFNASYKPDEDKHGLTLLASCQIACARYRIDPDFAPLMNLLLSENWNQALEWADSIK